MAMPIDQQLRYWGLAGLVFIALLWVMGDVLLPFITGMAMAYFLNPVVTKLQNRGVPRTAAVSALMALAFGVVVLAGGLIIPAVVTQAVQFSETAPDLLTRLQEFLTARFPDIAQLEDTLRNSLSSLGEAIRDRGAALAQGVLRSVSGLVGALVFLVVTPVVAFYLLLDWERLVRQIDDLLPRQHAPVLRHLAGEIDASIAGFVRGQVTVCFILAAYYATALGLIGLQFGLAIGVTAGLISFIPYIGAIIGGRVGDWRRALAVLGQPAGNRAGAGGVRFRADAGRKCAGAAHCRRFGSAAPGLAFVRRLGLWGAFGLYRHADRSAAGGQHRGAGALWRGAIHGQQALWQRRRAEMTPRQAALPLVLPARMGRADFVPSACNAAALGLLGAPLPGGRLVLHGPEGSGKTHLGHIWAEARNAVHLDGTALARADLPGAVAQGAVWLDNAAQVADSADGQTALFHLLNLAQAHDAEVVMAARPPRPRLGCDPARPCLAAGCLHSCRRRRA